MKPENSLDRMLGGAHGVGSATVRAAGIAQARENELTPGAVRVGNYKLVFNLRGDDGQATGGLAVDCNLGWKGPDKAVEEGAKECWRPWNVFWGRQAYAVAVGSGDL